MNIAKNILFIRKKYGLSQSELAEIAGVSDKAVSTWECSGKIPRMGALEKISTHFNIPKSIIIDGDIENNFFSTLSISLSSTEQQLIDNYRQLNGEGQEKLLDLSSDLVASGRYIKSAFSEMDSKKA